MFQQIELSHFKCFEGIDIPLQPLTLLSGSNASGKSSVMQAFALLHQTMREHEWTKSLALNGDAVQLGTAGDVVDQVYGRHICKIALVDEVHYKWSFSGERNQLSMALQSLTIQGEGEFLPDQGNDSFRHLLPSKLLASQVHGAMAKRIRGLTYLTAERLGPREYYSLDAPQFTPVVGARGEYAISALYSGRDSEILEGMVIQDAPPTRLRQVEAQMGRFFHSFGLEIDLIPRANAVTLGLRISTDTDFQRPIHVGFGLTQILPIIVATLSAREDDLLLIENPEVHLHPAGQAMMGKFLAEVVAAGVQVLIETHSDHVLNGVRRAVKSKIIPAEDVALHFFRPRQTRKTPSPK